MAALDFPTSPAVNDIYSANGKSWKWDGTSWVAQSSAFSGFSGFSGYKVSKGLIVASLRYIGLV